MLSHVPLSDPMDCGSPGSSVQGVSQVRMWEWVGISSSRGSSWPRNQTQLSYIAGEIFYHVSHQGNLLNQCGTIIYVQKYSFPEIVGKNRAAL